VGTLGSRLHVCSDASKPNWLMVAAAASVLQLCRPLAMRVRQWERLPARRGPTVLIANHQHPDEGEAVVGRTFLAHPWKPVVMVMSRRHFETGFFAARLEWTAPFTRTLNPRGLFARLGFLPVENQLSSRPLISLAEELRGAYGDLPLAEVLPADLLAKLGLSGRWIDELWRPAFFTKAQATVKVSQLLDPYRREVLENVRARTTGDIEGIVRTIRDGATLYLTPEGIPSADGRMRPLRGGILEAVLPVAEPWLCAIAYDPFRGRRLSMLYRVVRPADPDDLGASLASARPITTTALLATFLDGATRPFTRAEALQAVRAQLAALPETVFVDPELRRVEAAVLDALTTLVKRGTLEVEGERYIVTEHRTDPRFPQVADMIAFQRAMLEETLEATRRLRARNTPLSSTTEV
jgi:hypothetical protein